MEAKGFWDNRARAVEKSRIAAQLGAQISEWQKLQDDCDALIEIIRDGESRGDDSEFLLECSQEYEECAARWKKFEVALLFRGQYDELGAIISIHAGTGGVDAQDWAEMLLRMYLRFAERKGYRVSVIDKQEGKEAGIKSATIDIKGLYAYGSLSSEAGVHRLVRISPFDAEKMRHTSFALVEALPDLGEAEQVKIRPDDLRIDVFRSSGPGGQSVNTTDSAVRIVHLPTKLTVSCQSERSQHQNKERAMRILHAKLALLEEEKRNLVSSELRGEYHEAKWGNQIRSYILQPYQLVKDHRNGYETTDAPRVLDGDIDDFIEEYRKSRM